MDYCGEWKKGAVPEGGSDVRENLSWSLFLPCVNTRGACKHFGREGGRGAGDTPEIRKELDHHRGYRKRVSSSMKIGAATSS